MDSKTFDELAKATTGVTSRRGAVGLIAGAALAAGLTRFDLNLAAAKKGKGKNNKKRCKKLNQGCGGKKKCCKGLTCTGGVCVAQPACVVNGDCAANQICQNGACVPTPPECVINNDCGLNEICQNGSCVPTPDCFDDDDCDDNEACQGGTCNCPEQENGRCIRRCEVQNDCPGASSCRNHFPEDSSSIQDGICVDEPFILCDAANCNGDGGCDGDEICIATGCSSGTFKCSPFSVF